MIRTLLSTEPDDFATVLPETLRTQYGGDLRFAGGSGGRPYVIANFVSTLDGVVSFSIPGESGGRPISGSDEGDRFIMGLLRASVDAVMVASGTVEAVSPAHVWTPEFAYPPAKDPYRDYRKALGKPEQPLITIVSGSGRLALDRAVFQTPGVEVLILTTEPGSAKLKSAAVEALPSTRIRTHPASDGHITPSAILKILKEEFGVSIVLHEGGPTFFGEFLACGLADELFLTMAPQIAGRNGRYHRPGLVSNIEFTPATAPWLKLLTVKNAEDHLYLRYRRNGNA